MKKLIIYLFAILLFTPVACQHKNDTKNKIQQEMTFEWREALSAPAGYPIEIYRGGLISDDGGYVGFAPVIPSGKWGTVNYGTSSGKKSIPKFLIVEYLSYAERCFYKVDVEIL